MDLTAVRDEASRALATLSRTGNPDTAADLVGDLAERLLGGGDDSVDPRQMQAMLAGVVACQRALVQKDDPSARLSGLLVGLEQVRQAARNAVDMSAVAPDQPPGTLLASLTDRFGVRDELANLLAISTRQLHRWASGASQLSPEAETRVRTVAALVEQLQWVLPSPDGILSWFNQPNPFLDRQEPKALLSDPTAAPRLRTAASRLRSMTAA